MYGYLYLENRGLERLLDDVGFVPKLSFNATNFPHSFWNPPCMRRFELAYACIMASCAGFMRE